MFYEGYNFTYMYFPVKWNQSLYMAVMKETTRRYFFDRSQGLVLMLLL